MKGFLMCIMLVLAVGIFAEGQVPEEALVQQERLELPDASASTEFTSMAEARIYGDKWLSSQRRSTGHIFGDKHYKSAATMYKKGLRSKSKRTAMRNLKRAVKNWRIARNRYLKNRSYRKTKRRGCKRVRKCKVWRKCKRRGNNRRAKERR